LALSVRFAMGPMNVLEELHLLVDGLDGNMAKQLLHTLVDDLNEEKARETLRRMRDHLSRPFLEKFGFNT
jgi:hypothetical protein